MFYTVQPKHFIGDTYDDYLWRLQSSESSSIFSLSTDFILIDFTKSRSRLDLMFRIGMYLNFKKILKYQDEISKGLK